MENWQIITIVIVILLLLAFAYWWMYVRSKTETYVIYPRGGHYSGGCGSRLAEGDPRIQSGRHGRDRGYASQFGSAWNGNWFPYGQFNVPQL